MILLLHGVGLDHTVWDAVRPLLDDEVVAPDLRGHGGDVLDGPVDLVDLVPALDRPAHVVGFSLGGLIATRLAADRPALVRSLTLVSCIANRSPAERAAVRARLALAGSDLAASQEAALARWGEEHRAVIAPVLRANDPASYLACYRVFVEADGEVWPLYPGLSMPVLAITGAEDGGSTPAMAAALAAAVPDGECEIVPGARHLLPLDAPVALAAAIMRTSRRAER